MRAAALALAAGLAAAQAAAAQPPRPDALGLGAQVCATWPQAAYAAERATYMQWVYGALTRGTQGRGELRVLREPAELERWVARYCRSHPMDTLQAAAYALELDLKWEARKKAASSAAPPGPAPAPR